MSSSSPPAAATREAKLTVLLEIETVAEVEADREAAVPAASADPVEAVAIVPPTGLRRWK